MSYKFSSVCVSWLPVSVSCLNYVVVGLQPQAVGTPDLGSVHAPTAFLIPPTSKMHVSDKKN